MQLSHPRHQLHLSHPCCQVVTAVLQASVITTRFIVLQGYGVQLSLPRHHSYRIISTTTATTITTTSYNITNAALVPKTTSLNTSSAHSLEVRRLARHGGRRPSRSRRGSRHLPRQVVQRCALHLDGAAVDDGVGPEEEAGRGRVQQRAGGAAASDLLGPGAQGSRHARQLQDQGGQHPAPGQERRQQPAGRGSRIVLDGGRVLGLGLVHAGPGEPRHRTGE